MTLDVDPTRSKMAGMSNTANRRFIRAKGAVEEDRGADEDGAAVSAFIVVRSAFSETAGAEASLFLTSSSS